MASNGPPPSRFRSKSFTGLRGRGREIDLAKAALKKTAKRPEITVLIPTYNRALFLSEAIDSILKQTLQPSQILVIDDGSEDDTETLIKGFAGKVEYLWQQNSGKSAALNAGMKKAKGDLIWIFDDDDIAKPHALRCLVEALEGSTAGFAYGRYSRFKNTSSKTSINKLFAHRLSIPQNISDFGLHKALMFHNFIMQPALLVRKSCYDVVGPFNEAFTRSQDYEMLLRLTEKYSGVAVPRVVFSQRQHDGLRGTQAAPVACKSIGNVWQSFDKVLFTSIYSNSNLAEFCPADRKLESLTPDQLMTARIIRGSIAARKCLWELAHNDYQEAFRLAADIKRVSLNKDERSAFRQVLARGNLSLLDIDAQSQLLSMIASIETAKLQSEIRAALLYPLPIAILLLLLKRQFRKGRAMLELYIRITGVGSRLRL